MANKRSPRMEKSLEWIRRHPFASNLDVPEELLREWIIPNPAERGDENPQNDFHLTVFVFGVMQLRLLDNPQASSQETALNIKMSEVLVLFEKWQAKLAMAEVHRTGECVFAPLPLFRFPDGEELAVYKRD